MEHRGLAVRVRAPSRLHFGLLAFGDAAPRQFGGVGVMIEQPGTEVIVEALSAAETKGKPADAATERAAECAIRFQRSLAPAERMGSPPLLVRASQAAPQHVGLGSGTQLAMAVARAMAIWAGKSDMPPEELARRVGRGRRSAIGVHGFERGGFIVEAGKRDPDRVSPLVARLNFPTEWYFVLILPPQAKGLHGSAEREAFDGLSQIAPAVTADLCRLTLLGMLPAVAECDFDAFSESLFELSQKVGHCFAACQGGVYSSPLAADILSWFQKQGIRGVAQSSWGPTLCAVAESRFRAEWLAARLADTLGAQVGEILCTPANNLGAKVEITDEAQ